MAQSVDRATLGAIAERALDEWDICAARLELISISENTVFRVDTDVGETYVLRIHRPGYHNLAELNSEQQWTAALKQAGIGVPLPRLTREGTRLRHESLCLDRQKPDTSELSNGLKG